MPTVQALRQRTGLTQSEFARVIGCSLRALSEYESGKPPARSAASARLRELAGLLDLAERVMPRDSASKWFSRGIGDFAGASPSEVFARGDSARIYAVLYGVMAGVAQ
jgi:transcriptional regulator with XRE-family HTH domain